VKGLCNNDDGFVGDEDANARSKNDKRENCIVRHLVLSGCV
jgi:hypothetical protein